MASSGTSPTSFETRSFFCLELTNWAPWLASKPQGRPVLTSLALGVSVTSPCQVLYECWGWKWGPGPSKASSSLTAPSPVPRYWTPQKVRNWKGNGGGLVKTVCPGYKKTDQNQTQTKEKSSARQVQATEWSHQLRPPSFLFPTILCLWLAPLLMFATHHMYTYRHTNS